MSHPLQQAALQKLHAAEDVFPHDRAFLEAFIVRTNSELWEVLANMGGDEDQASRDAGWLSYVVAGTAVGKDGALPVWYDMKPSEYRKAKEDAVKRLRAVERELAALVPGLDHTSLLHMLWPDDRLPHRDVDSMEDAADEFYDCGAITSVRKLLRFYDNHPEHCPTIAGNQGVIESICEEVEEFEPRRYSKPKTGPAWPRHFVCQLFEELTEDKTFAGLNLASKYRLIDSCLHFYAGWIGKQEDSEGWTAERVENAVTR